MIDTIRLDGASVTAEPQQALTAAYVFLLELAERRRARLVAASPAGGDQAQASDKERGNA